MQPFGELYIVSPRASPSSTSPPSPRPYAHQASFGALEREMRLCPAAQLSRLSRSRAAALRLPNALPPSCTPAALQGHKINVVCGGLFILSSIIHMIVVPSDMMHTDSGVDDACTNVTTSVPAPGSYLLGECAAGPGPAGCGPSCPEEYAAAKEDNLGCGDDVSADDCVASVQTHQHVASCPAGCLFTPRFTFEEESRFGALIARVLWALVGLLGAGLMADPAALGPCKVCSVIWIIGSVLSILWHLFYLWYLMYPIPFLCDGKAPQLLPAII